MTLVGEVFKVDAIGVALSSMMGLPSAAASRS
jgi:hypothetical protein